MRNKSRGITGVLLTAMAAGVLAAGCSGVIEKAGAAEDPAAQRTIPVQTTPVAQRDFTRRIRAQGNLQAKEFALVAARIDGVMTDLFVKEGDAVVANKTPLFQIDKVKVKQAVEISKQDLSLAKCSQREAQANLDSLQAQFDKAQIDYDRFRRLREKDAVTLDAMEQQEMRFKATRAGLEHAKTLVDLAAEQEKKAQAALAIAEKTLDDSLVIAPISGRISYKFLQLSEYAGGGKPVLRIDNPAVLEMSALVPAEYFARVKEGETPVRISAYGVDVGTHPVSYKSPTIQPALRTFEIKCVIENPPEGVAPGAMADVEVVLEERKALGAPQGAFMTRAGQKVVFVVENGVARMTPVETGLETEGWIELVNPPMPEGAPVVTMGQNLVDDGMAVLVQKEGA